MFRRAMWLLGAAMTLESFRRGFIGGSMLSLFIIKEFGLDKAAVPTMAWMRKYLDLEEALLSKIPPYLEALVTPFTDYHESAKLYLVILDILAEQQRPRTCQFYWGEGEEE
ncbi:unnamed protein product [marine sediment metagenome]|uniref:Uncharacterized protein n=1 Tax=marine sediment metagenome TaxID=412755 RepID=X1RX47_9ZZZZ